MSHAASSASHSAATPSNVEGQPFTAPHTHVFLGTDHRRNEHRIWLVIALTALMMLLEIGAGSYYGSMALVADGWHMSTHAGAMLITALAYGYARRHAADPRFSFGTGKLGDLAGLVSATVLALVSLLIGWESLLRLVQPVTIGFGESILVALAGLAVNLLCAWLLRGEHGHGHGHGHGHHHDVDVGAGHEHEHEHDGGRDNNLRAAYVHVLSDALTSVLAIAALLLGRSYGWIWADPLMGVVGALVIARWSWGLLRESALVLLDAPPAAVRLSRQARQLLNAAGAEVLDLHLWQLGPGHFAAMATLRSAAGLEAGDFKAQLASLPQLSHVTIEVQHSKMSEP